MEGNCKVTARPKNIKEFFTTWYFWKPFLGVAAGVLLGFLYYYFIENKTTPLTMTSDAYNSMFFGGLLGFFITGSPCASFRR